MLSHNSGNHPLTRKVKSETSPCTQKGRERQKKDANHSRLTGGSFDEQGNLYHRRLVFHDCMASRSLQPPARNLTVYTEALTGFSHVFQSRWSQHHIAFSKPPPGNHLLLWEQCVEGTLRGATHFWSSFQVKHHHILPMTSSSSWTKRLFEVPQNY